MSTVQLIVIFAALFTVASASSPIEELSPEVVHYTTSLIHHHFEQNIAIPDCWFYESRSTRTLLNPIVSSAKLSSIPKRILLDSGVVQVQRQPTMLVLISEDFTDAQLKRSLYGSTFNQYMRIIVLYSTVEQYEDAARLFKAVFLYNVVFVRTDCLTVRYSKVFKNEDYEKQGFVSFEEVFFDQASDLGGYVLKLSTYRHDRVIRMESKLTDDIVQWTSEAVERMNGSYRIYPIVCDVNGDCFVKAYIYNTTTWFDFSLDEYSLDQVLPNLMVSSAIPSMVGIAALRGQRMTVLDVFIAPFKYELWIALLLLLLCSSCLMLFGLIQNDLVLLALCGLECYSVQRVSRSERLATLTLVILFFVLKCSYETRLVSLMTSASYAADPRTLDDLIKANITIRHVSLDESIYQACDDPRLKLVFSSKSIDKGQKWDPKDKTKAYFGGINRMNAAIRHRILYDHANRRTHFVILDGFSGLIMTFRPIHYRSVLAARLAWFELAFFEAGLLHITADEIAKGSFGLMYNNEINDELVTNDVGMTELAPAWYSVAVGWTISVLVFGLELGKRAWTSRGMSSRLTNCIRILLTR